MKKREKPSLRPATKFQAEKPHRNQVKNVCGTSRGTSLSGSMGGIRP
jgi:hypothetical protein